jgi:hypothetical protein
MTDAPVAPSGFSPERSARIRSGVERTWPTQPIVAIFTEQQDAQFEARRSGRHCKSRWPSGKIKMPKRVGHRWSTLPWQPRSHWLDPVYRDSSSDWEDEDFDTRRYWLEEEHRRRAHEDKSLSDLFEQEELDSSNEHHRQRSRVDNYIRKHKLSTQQWVNKKTDVLVNTKASKKRRK